MGKYLHNSYADILCRTIVSLCRFGLENYSSPNGGKNTILAMYNRYGCYTMICKRLCAGVRHIILMSYSIDERGAYLPCLVFVFDVQRLRFRQKNRNLRLTFPKFTYFPRAGSRSIRWRVISFEKKKIKHQSFLQ